MWPLEKENIENCLVSQRVKKLASLLKLLYTLLKHLVFISYPFHYYLVSSHLLFWCFDQW